MGASMENLKGLIDVNSIVGAPITTPDGTTIIPVSKVSFGFASGGSDLPTSTQKEMFGGASGGGVTIQPLAFLVIRKDGVRMIQVADKNSVSERLVNMVPDVVDTVTSFIKKPSPAEPEPIEPIVVDGPAE